MYNKIYEILEEKGRIKTAIILDGPDMGKKCIVRQPGNPDAAAQEKSLIPEQEEDREIWEKYLPLLNDARETKVITADGIRIFVEDYRKNQGLLFSAAVTYPSLPPIWENAGLSCDHHG